MYLPYQKSLIKNAKLLRKNQTFPERKLWYEFLNTQQPRWIRQRTIGSYIVDFYCSKLKYVIEVDGDTYLDPAAMGYDKQRTQYLESLGLRVVRFDNAEVLEDFENVIEKIQCIVNTMRISP